MSGSARAARRTSRTNCSQPCAMSSAGMLRNQQRNGLGDNGSRLPMQEVKLKGLTSEELDQLAINTIRTLSIDAVQQAKSGHPGMPMALAPLVYTIWNEV